jgi:hypothetical protein
MTQNAPFIIADRSAEASFKGANTIHEIWAMGDPAPVRAAVRAAGFQILQDATADEVGATAGLASLSWAFGYLSALGVLTGLVALAAILLYLAARQRATQLSYVLARRMGLRPGSHRWSIAMEVAGMLTAALLVGAVLAWGGAKLVYGKVDPLPLLPPGMLFRYPTSLFVLTALVLPAVALIGAAVSHSVAGRTDVAALMREGSTG